MIRPSNICASRNASRRIIGWTSRTLRRPEAHHLIRRFHPSLKQASEAETPKLSSAQFELFRRSLNVPEAVDPAAFEPHRNVTVNGFLGKRRDQSSKLSFVDIQLNDKTRRNLQVVSGWETEGSEEHATHLSLKDVPAYSPVSITGTLELNKRGGYELRLSSIKPLNEFPSDIIVSKSVVWSPNVRHLQTRFDTPLYERLVLRDEIQGALSTYLRNKGFVGVETPVLFKSTPEGAREFLVPTRRRGFVYALPQSPQQYKQVLMAGGIPRYFQFAKCFRDEDHRADRQPEFTQLDMEMAFATGTTVQETINGMIQHIMEKIFKHKRTSADGKWHFSLAKDDSPDSAPVRFDFPTMSYNTAITKYGIDKPDLRIKASQASLIRPVGHFLSDEFKSMITNLDSPIIEACKFRFDGSRAESAKLIRKFFDTLPKTTHKLRGHSTPGVFVFDSSKPLQGLSSLGYEAADKLIDHSDDGWTSCEDGDVIIIHARENNGNPGGSTELGRIRKLIYDLAVEKGLLPRSDELKFTWVDKFPLFSPSDEDPGQGGAAGFSATHHPFTAPLTPEDVDLLVTDPLKAVADHYDLVLNGVEIGGGSRRIHIAGLQEYIMRDVLKMPDEGVRQFSHLLEALRAGCPPHAGFALGFDRFLSVLFDVPSVRDVIAFPKTNKGEDPFAGSPSEATLAQKRTYHLFVDPAANSKAA
ncbi:tRNA synthetases class II-domain-containing protein [Poronia punctata]|nr:tRNA synthetases class II-domain-containing protein [Poronia punctata]